MKHPYFLITAAALSGCATAVVDERTIFSDPATFALYDCSQLAEAHNAGRKRIEELEALMAKAKTGAAGSVVSEVAYRPDYTVAQARLKEANAAWDRNQCNEPAKPPLGRPSVGMQPSAEKSLSRAY
jgi:hypothetical protein